MTATIKETGGWRREKERISWWFDWRSFKWKQKGKLSSENNQCSYLCMCRPQMKVCPLPLAVDAVRTPSLVERDESARHKEPTPRKMPCWLLQNGTLAIKLCFLTVNAWRRAAASAVTMPHVLKWTITFHFLN